MFLFQLLCLCRASRLVQWVPLSHHFLIYFILFYFYYFVVYYVVVFLFVLFVFFLGGGGCIKLAFLPNTPLTGVVIMLLFYYHTLSLLFFPSAAPMAHLLLIPLREAHHQRGEPVPSRGQRFYLHGHESTVPEAHSQESFREIEKGGGRHLPAYNTHSEHEDIR